MPSRVLTEAQRLVASGLSVIPILADGTKRPAVAWKSYQDRLPTPDELRRWFGRGGVGLAIIGGEVSEGLEILDFDDSAVFTPWGAMVETLCPGLLATLPLVRTPTDGRHAYYRCQVIAGNQRLARKLNAEGRPGVLVETRGTGGYVLAPPSPPACHPLRQPYVLRQGDLAHIPTITPAERQCLLNAARRFNAYVPPERPHQVPSSPRQPAGERPGDVFSARVSWAEILEPHGWIIVGYHGEVTLWKRPGKRERGVSATTNFGGSDVLYVFSSNAFPFEHGTAYSKFAAFALLEHRGDFQAAARLLSLKGYRTPRAGEVLLPLDDPWLGPRWRMHGIPLTVRRIGQGRVHG
jgi:Bifunctional DNA primase/polymerase, N-terminal